MNLQEIQKCKVLQKARNMKKYTKYPKYSAFYNTW